MARTASQKLSLLSDVSKIISHSHDLEETLKNIVQVVSERMHAEVCSIYLLDEGGKQLTLRATVGLDPEAVGKVQMNVDEGLTGLVVRQMKPVAEEEASKSPHYKFFPGISEEKYHSYLGVPLVERKTVIGVLTIQTLVPRKFDRDEIRMLETIAVQMSGLITNSRMLAQLQEKAEHYRHLEEELRRFEKPAEQPVETAEKKEERRGPKVLRGHPAAPGFRMGFVHIHQHDFHIHAGFAENAEDTESEKQRLTVAFEKSIQEVSELKNQVTDILSEEDSIIFHGHLLMLEDKGFRQRIESVIDEGRRAEFAVEIVAKLYKERLSQIDDAYLRERVSDIEDVERRLLGNLLGIEREQREFEDECVVVADDISPSELIYLESPKLMGLVLARGGVTSHVAILAKSLELPAVVGVSSILTDVSPGDFIIVDGNSGVVYVNPNDDVINTYVRMEADYETMVEELRDMRDLPADTLDGKRIVMEANVGLLGEIPLCLESGAEGIGLFRTEMPFLSRSNFPTEEDHHHIFSKAVEALNGSRLTIRTVDIGGEKTPEYLPMPEEPNPLLGWRSMRLALDKPEMLETQLRAIVRVASQSPLRVMFPMISGIEELRAAKDVLNRVIRGLGCQPKLEIGIMVEVPSAVAVAHHLAKEVNFFSIGTNDLIQYVLAVDRNNPMVSDRYQAHHPAVLAAIDQTVRAARDAGVSVSVCGEMAGWPKSAILLVGMGIDNLSMTPNTIPFVKRVLRAIDSRKAAALAKEALTLGTTGEIEALISRTIDEWGIRDLVEMRPAGSGNV